jgi:Predicted membrane protein (DUF2157)
MQTPIFKSLHAQRLISGESLQKAEAAGSVHLFSLYWELRLLLYLGVLLLTGGLGILVYKNIDTIGHQAVLAFIALVTAGSFFYCFRKKPPFSWEKVNAANPFFDYILLLGSLSLLIFLGYLQYEYNVFGDNYGLATFIPMVILFASAYEFDHLGILSLAITNLAAWAGIAITPLSLLKEGSFADHRLIFTGISLGGLLLAAGVLTSARRLKPHFETTYNNFGIHLLFIASLAGLFTYDHIYLLWFAAMAVVAWVCLRQAMARKSFYFVFVIILYTYIGLCDVVIQLLAKMSDHYGDIIYLGLMYFILSAAGLAILLIRLNRQLKSHDRL